MVEHLDLKDRRILYELDINSRQPFSDISKKVKIPKNVVNYRVNRLIERKIIRGFYTVMDMARLGYLNFRVYLKLQDADLEKEKEIIDYLANQKNTWWVAGVSVPWDMVAALWVKSTHEFNAFWMGFLEKYARFIRRKSISLYVEMLHYNKAYLIGAKGEKEGFQMIGREKKVELSDTDLNILQIIAENARVSITEIARKMKKTPIVVRYAIRKMKANGIIQGFRLLIDYEKLGYLYYWLEIELNDTRKLKSLISYMVKRPTTVYIDQAINGECVDIGIQVKSPVELLKTVKDLKSRFKEIRGCEYYQIIKNYKVRYMPRA